MTTRCLESRPRKDGTRRRRYQRADGTRFKTIEIPVEDFVAMRAQASRLEKLRLLVLTAIAKTKGAP